MLLYWLKKTALMLVAVCLFATLVAAMSVSILATEQEISTETLCQNGHTPSQWQVSIPPTATSQGEKYQYCLVCEQVIAISSVPPTQSETNQSVQTTPAGDKWVAELEPEEEREENIVTLPSETKQEETKKHISSTQTSGCGSSLPNAFALTILCLVAAGGCAKRKQQPEK